jgi:obg-like ATPase 1
LQDKQKQEELETLLACEEMLKAGKDVRAADWSNKQIEVINDQYFLSAKNVVFLVNIAQTDFETQKNKWLVKIKEWVAENAPGSLVIPFSATFEKAWEKMTPEEQAAATAEKKIKSMLPKIIKVGYESLQLCNFFTSGADEVRAWTIRKFSKAPQAAGTIHTDFEKGFICADIMSFADFKEQGSEAACKAAGKYRQQGREYVVEDGDIAFFKFNVTSQPKKK